MEHRELTKRLLDIKESSSSIEEYKEKSKETFPDVSETILDVVWCAFETLLSVLE